MFFVMIGHDKPDRQALRAATKARHKDHLDAAAPGIRVLQSGPLLSAGGEECGSLLVIAAETPQEVQTFLDRDPYVEAGLYATREIRQWLWRRGNPFLDAEPEGSGLST